MAILAGFYDVPNVENTAPPVDIPGLIWYIGALDVRGMAFVGLSMSPEFQTD